MSVLIVDHRNLKYGFCPSILLTAKVLVVAKSNDSNNKAKRITYLDLANYFGKLVQGNKLVYGKLQIKQLDKSCQA